MSNRALFLSVDSAMFLPAVFTAHTAIANARAHDFDTFIVVPENSIEPAWIDWAQSEIGVVVKGAPLSEHVRITKTANPAIRPAALYRYYFDPRYGKPVYLDADIRVNGDISRLFDLDLGSHPFAAAPDVALAAYDGTRENWIAD